MRNHYGQSDAREALGFLEELRATNRKMVRILDKLPSIGREETSELSHLLRAQRRLMERNPRFHSAEERFEIDKEKFTAMHLMQRSMKFLRESSLKNRGA